MKNFDLKNETIIQAIDLGFDFHLSTDDNTTVEELKSLLLDFFDENREKLPREEDECEVSGSGNGQSVIYGDYICSGEIVNFSAHWHKAPETKVFHSEFVRQDAGLMKNTNLYYLVGETDYNAPAGYYFNKKTKRHEKIK